MQGYAQQRIFDCIDEYLGREMCKIVQRCLEDVMGPNEVMQVISFTTSTKPEAAGAPVPTVAAVFSSGRFELRALSAERFSESQNSSRLVLTGCLLNGKLAGLVGKNFKMPQSHTVIARPLGQSCRTRTLCRKGRCNFMHWDVQARKTGARNWKLGIKRAACILPCLLLRLLLHNSCACVSTWKVGKLFVQTVVTLVCCASFPTLVGRHWHVRLSCAMHRVYAFQCDFYMGSIGNSQAQLRVVNFRVTGISPRQPETATSCNVTETYACYKDKTYTGFFSVLLARFSVTDCRWLQMTADDCRLCVLLLVCCCYAVALRCFHCWCDTDYTCAVQCSAGLHPGCRLSNHGHRKCLSLRDPESVNSWPLGTTVAPLAM